MICFDHVTKTYPKNGVTIHALDDLSLQVNKGEFIMVRGPSGSGKTTFLLTVAGMLRPSAGEVRLADRSLYALSARQRAGVRASEIGFVFQMFHLVPYLTVLDNVVLAGAHGGDRDAAAKLLEDLGMGARLTHRPAELSAGECQRTALARAFLNNPPLILADEPTGNLDAENERIVMEQLKAYQQRGGTVVVVTHNERLDPIADRVICLEAGRLRTAEADV